MVAREEGMKVGYLNKYFTAVAVKRLSFVEADASVSNQHEFNGVSLLKQMFGTGKQRSVIPTIFMYMGDGNDDVATVGELTWYDARYNHPTRTEWRLYYPTNEVTTNAAAGDTLFICLKSDGKVLAIITQRDSVIENQLFWLFDVKPDDQSNGFITNTDLTNPPSDKVEIAAQMILRQIGIDATQETEDFTDMLINKFGNEFPTTRQFSEFARSTVIDVDPIEQPDDALVKWYSREETMFMCMEKHLIHNRLKEGFVVGGEVDVDGFIQFSLSVNNRRKSRAGLSLENHLEAIFEAQKIRCSRTPVTENKSKPDFIFPSIEHYKNEQFPASKLTMLGAKTTTKDRWRQVLKEANRIDRKHLITLEGAISENQTNEMIYDTLQLVVPKPIHGSYTNKQQKWLYTLEDFITEVREKQTFVDAIQP